MTNVLVKQPFGCLEAKFKESGRKDVYHEVDICNGCRFDHKDPTHWVIEGPRALTKTLLSTKITILKIRDSCNRYRRFYIKGREQDRLK
jgi:NADH-quinone oxidoreductase subunit G